MMGATHHDLTYNYCQTWSGRQFDLDKPDASMIYWRDIVHALCQTNRFGGHSLVPVSVAAHTLAVAKLCKKVYDDENTVRAALLHDANEAYVGDTPKPMKNALMKIRRLKISPIGALEDLVDQAIQGYFDFRWTEAEMTRVKEMDTVALLYEKRHFMRASDIDWGLDDNLADLADLHVDKEWYYQPEFAKRLLTDKLYIYFPHIWVDQDGL